MSKSRVFALEILAPLLLVAILSQVLRIEGVVHYLDKFKLPGWQVGNAVQVEQQLLHATMVHQANIVLAGSSSVFNGIDQDLVSEQLGKSVANFGMTNFQAYELQLLSNLWLKPSHCTVVYLYNTFSFADTIHPQAGSTRWQPVQGLKLLGQNPSLDNVKLTADGTLSASLPIIQYRLILRSYLQRLVANELAEAKHWLDYPDDDTNLEQVEYWQAPNARWLVDAYQQSMQADSMSYQSLRDFLQQANNDNVQIILVPAPEPDYQEHQINKQVVDAHVALLAQQYQVPFIARENFKALEQDKRLFRDYVHLNRQGRDVFTKLLAQQLKQLEVGCPS